MPARNPFEPGEDERGVRFDVDNLASDIVSRFPTYQAYVEKVCFDIDINNIAKRTELEDLLERATNEFEDMRAQLNDTLSPWAYSSDQSTPFDNLSQSERVPQETSSFVDVWELERSREQRFKLILGTGMLALGTATTIVSYGNLPGGVIGMSITTLGLTTVFSKNNI